MERPLTVGQLARATGVPAKTIRYYEQVGVLPVPRRSEFGYRHYSRTMSIGSCSSAVRAPSGSPSPRSKR